METTTQNLETLFNTSPDYPGYFKTITRTTDGEWIVRYTPNLYTPIVYMVPVDTSQVGGINSYTESDAIIAPTPVNNVATTTTSSVITNVGPDTLLSSINPVNEEYSGEITEETPEQRAMYAEQEELETLMNAEAIAQQLAEFADDNEEADVRMSLDLKLADSIDRLSKIWEEQKIRHKEIDAMRKKRRQAEKNGEKLQVYKKGTNPFFISLEEMIHLQKVWIEEYETVFKPLYSEMISVNPKFNLTGVIKNELYPGIDSFQKVDDYEVLYNQVYSMFLDNVGNHSSEKKSEKHTHKLSEHVLIKIEESKNSKVKKHGAVGAGCENC
jgi:hypothetical protein